MARERGVFHQLLPALYVPVAGVPRPQGDIRAPPRGGEPARADVLRRGDGEGGGERDCKDDQAYVSVVTQSILVLEYEYYISVYISGAHACCARMF